MREAIRGHQAPSSAIKCSSAIKRHQAQSSMRSTSMLRNQAQSSTSMLAVPRSSTVAIARANASLEFPDDSL